MQGADKLTVGQNIRLQVPHQVTSLLNGTASQSMTGECVARYQASLGENPWVRVKAMRTLNLAAYLPEEAGEPFHSCEEVLDEVFSSQPHLVDTAIPMLTLSSS
jgi:hypothetical protein